MLGYARPHQLVLFINCTIVFFLIYTLKIEGDIGESFV
jgi:hypothetical protein